MQNTVMFTAFAFILIISKFSYVHLSCFLGKFFRGCVNPKGNTLSGMNPVISEVNKWGKKSTGSALILRLHMIF